MIEEPYLKEKRWETAIWRFLFTKGDANEQEDLNETDYDAVIGRVVKHLPIPGLLTMILSVNTGKVLLLILALSGALINILAGRYRQNKRNLNTYAISGRVCGIIYLM